MTNDIGANTLVHLNIRSLREKNGLTQEQVADYLNMSVNGYGDIERGETDIKLSRLTQISNLFDVSLAELVNPEKILSVDNINSHILCSINHNLTSQSVELYKLVIESKDNEIASLKKLISLLESKQ